MNACKCCLINAKNMFYIFSQVHIFALHILLIDNRNNIVKTLIILMITRDVLTGT